jgi:hypothetical protein
MADQSNVENEHDPGASTQMFRAFVNEGQAEAASDPKLNGRVLAVVGAAVILIAVIAAIAVL